MPSGVTHQTIFKRREAALGLDLNATQRPG
jgi:hypothetical protein